MNETFDEANETLEQLELLIGKDNARKVFEFFDIGTIPIDNNKLKKYILKDKNEKDLSEKIEKVKSINSTRNIVAHKLDSIKAEDLKQLAPVC